MAYMSQEKKAKIAARLKDVVPSGWKYSLAVDHHSTLVMTIRSAPVDLLGDVRKSLKENYPAETGYGSYNVGDHFQVNPYHFEKQFSKALLPKIASIFRVLNDGNHDRSDIMTDYFDVGWYVDLNIGKWNKPFVVTPA